MSTTSLRKISDELEAILTDEIPAIPWKSEVMGPAFPKELKGFICCDSVDFSPNTKVSQIAEAEFTIEIICPNPKDKANDTTLVEDYAMQIKDVLQKNRSIDGWAQDSAVRKILFATPAGVSSIGIAIISFIVKYIDE
jgi:hypothetical protein